MKIEEVANCLQKGATLVNMRFVKTFATDLLKKLIENHQVFVTN